MSRVIYFGLIEPFRSFPGSEAYWKSRYAQGGNSGAGSYDALASFKAEFINGLVARHQVASIIEFGCGDGNQLTLSRYPSYLGVDISAEAIQLCRKRFPQDVSKSFVLASDYAQQQAEMSLSLDVIYHLVEDRVFQEYMKTLFSAATRFVVIYSSNTDKQPKIQGKHVRHRRFTDWVDANMPAWELLQHLPNRYPYDSSTNTGSFADFYLYARRPDTAPGTNATRYRS